MSALAGRLRAASSLLANRYKVLSAISVFTSYKIKNEKIPLSLSHSRAFRRKCTEYLEFLQRTVKRERSTSKNAKNELNSKRLLVKRFPAVEKG